MSRQAPSKKIQVVSIPTVNVRGRPLGSKLSPLLEKIQNVGHGKAVRVAFRTYAPTLATLRSGLQALFMRRGLTEVLHSQVDKDGIHVALWMSKRDPQKGE